MIYWYNDIPYQNLGECLVNHSLFFWECDWKKKAPRTAPGSTGARRAWAWKAVLSQQWRRITAMSSGSRGMRLFK